jgi:hypothetical protein
MNARSAGFHNVMAQAAGLGVERAGIPLLYQAASNMIWACSVALGGAPANFVFKPEEERTGSPLQADQSLRTPTSAPPDRNAIVPVLPARSLADLCLRNSVPRG